MSENAPRDRSPHQPAGRVRTGLSPVHSRAFRTGHLKRGSRAFDVMFRFVGGVSLGCVLASVFGGGLLEPVILQAKWPHHPVTESVALGFLIGIFFAPFVRAYARAKEIYAAKIGEEAPSFRGLGRVTAVLTCFVTLAVLWLLDMRWISLLAE